MKSLLTVLLLCFTALLNAAVDGTVVNRTTGKPQPSAAVVLLKLSSGMDSVGKATTGADGKFSIDQQLESGVPYLLQAIHDEVTYNLAIAPGTPSTGLTVEVFNASARAEGAKVVQHMMLFEPSDRQLAVNESIVYRNEGKVTLNDPEGGTLRFYLPDGVKSDQVRITVHGPQGMPLQRRAEKTAEPHTFRVNYPVKPGETRFDLLYTMPKTDVFKSKVLHGGGPVRVVAPKGVQLTGDGVTDLGAEPRTQAHVYSLANAEFAVKIAGTGSLRDTAAAAGEGGDEGSPEPPIEQKRAAIYQRIYPVVGLGAAMLLAGFVLLYRTPVPAGKVQRRS